MCRWPSKPREKTIISFHINRILVSMDSEERIREARYELPRVRTSG